MPCLKEEMLVLCLLCRDDVARSGKALDGQAGMHSDGSWEMGLGGCCTSWRRAMSENGVLNQQSPKRHFKC